MKKFIFLTAFLLTGLFSFAQFGNFKKRADLEKFKDTRLVIVLLPDSAYSASIIAAVERYWTFTGYEFAEDTALYRYKKGDYAFLYFSKSKGSKIKAKVASSEEDMNAFVVTKKYSKRIVPDNLLLYGFCSNRIDTADWEFETTRAIQLMNNYLNYAVQVERDGDLSISSMMNNYPSDKNQLLDKKLIIEDKQLELKGKEDATTLFDGDVEEVDVEEIHKAIKWQDNGYVYYYYSKDEKFCNKLVLSAANSELMYFTSTSPDNCKCVAKDLKALKEIKVKAQKTNK
ncbi:MAG: hypothetical protein KA981_03740 [Bacteroidia bacterium]|nr:hypothetical protein [Bacteroidia bacterium]